MGGLPDPEPDGTWASAASTTVSASSEPDPDWTPPDPSPAPASHGRIARFGVGLLSALIPGLGHLVTGRRRMAAIFLAPVLLGLAVLAVLFLTNDPLSLAASLLDPSVVGVIVVIEGLFLVWRLLAVVSSMVDRSFPRFRVADAIGLVIVLALVAVPQAGVGALTLATQQAEANVFDPEAFPSEEPQPTDTPELLSPGESPFPSDSLLPSGTPAQPRVTVLLIGVD